MGSKKEMNGAGDASEKFEVLIDMGNAWSGGEIMESRGHLAVK